jgi:hypothetical protein
MKQKMLATSVYAKDFRPHSKIASEPMGLGPCNQSIASGFEAAEIKIGFWRFLTVFGRPAAPSRALARVEAALARRSDHPGFARRSGSVRAVKTINDSRWRVP